MKESIDQTACLKPKQFKCPKGESWTLFKPFTTGFELVTRSSRVDILTDHAYICPAVGIESQLIVRYTTVASALYAIVL